MLTLRSGAGHPSGAAMSSAAHAASRPASHGLAPSSTPWNPSVSAEPSRLSCPSLWLGLSSAFAPFCSAPGGSASSPGLTFCSAPGFGCWTCSGPSPCSCEGLLSWQWHRGQVSCTYSHFFRQPAWKKWLHGVITAVFMSWKTKKKRLLAGPFLSPCTCPASSHGSSRHRADRSSPQTSRMFLVHTHKAPTFKFTHTHTPATCQGWLFIIHGLEMRQKTLFTKYYHT